MKLVDTDETVVIVTGTTLSAEERDRPLAYWLKQEIDRRGGGHPYRKAVVVGDAWFLEHRIFHLNPTIAIGGPGVNGVAAQLGDALPAAWRDGERAFIQRDFDADVRRAAIWGMDAGATADAVQAFVREGFLSDLLQRIWRFRSGVFV